MEFATGETRFLFEELNLAGVVAAHVSELALAVTAGGLPVETREFREGLVRKIAAALSAAVRALHERDRTGPTTGRRRNAATAARASATAGCTARSAAVTAARAATAGRELAAAAPCESEREKRANPDFSRRNEHRASL